MLLFAGRWWIKQQSLEEFRVQAESTAAFFSSSRIPASPQMAEYLSAVLGTRVSFFLSDYELPYMERDEERVTVPVANRIDLTGISLTRKMQRTPSIWRDSAFRNSFIIFWIGALGVGYLVARAVINPLLSFTRALPEITGTERSDEIGDLARRFQETESARLDAEKRSALALLAGSFAHEVKNPLAAARMHVELIDHPQYSPIILQQLDRVESLVLQWQYLLRPESPKTTTTPVYELLLDMQHRLQPMADHADVEILVTPSDLNLELDRKRMAQVFDNLAVNAIQAMPSGGQLSVGTEGRRILFLDTGKGFSEKAIQRAGEMFFTTKEGGMGIGLYASKQIIEAHNGRLRLQNRVDASNKPTQAGLGARVEIDFS